jgi:hypothetical protein
VTTATTDATTPAGEKESSFDPALIALFGTVVATAAIGILLARRTSPGKEPPPPPAAV